MAEINGTNIQNNEDNLVANVHRRKWFPKQGIIIILALIAIAVLCVIASRIFQTNSHKRVETYRGVCWGMTKEEINALETKRGNTIIDAELGKNKVAYTIFDLIDDKSEMNRCVYIFDGEGETLSSFLIGSLNDNGDELFTTVIPGIVDLYGDGEYSEVEEKGTYYFSANWNNENETIEGLSFISPLKNEAYFSFTYNNKDDNE